MKQPDPIELLEQKLVEYERDLQKSVYLYQTNKIDVKTHLTHKENLQTLICKYKQAILILKP